MSKYYNVQEKHLPQLRSNHQLPSNTQLMLDSRGCVNLLTCRTTLNMPFVLHQFLKVNVTQEC